MSTEPPPPPGPPPSVPPPPPPVPPPPGSPPGPGYPPPVPYGYSTQTTNGFAVAALVIGILGAMGCFAWIVALVFGYIAKRQIDRSGGTQKGRGMAIAGIVLGYVWGALVLVYLALAIATTA
jgi:Domain of unknown function (DUF4190)